MNQSEVAASTRAAEIADGRSVCPLADGPKLLIQFVSTGGAKQPHFRSPERLDLASAAVFLPRYVHLHETQLLGQTSRVSASKDEDGKTSAYACLTSHERLEMVAVLNVGVWGVERRTWWPGIYEIPLLQALHGAGMQFLNAALPLPAMMHVSLIDLSGTAIVTESDTGYEQPFPIPEGVDVLNLPAVTIAPQLKFREELVASLNKVRSTVGMARETPWYF